MLVTKDFQVKSIPVTMMMQDMQRLGDTIITLNVETL